MGVVQGQCGGPSFLCAPRRRRHHPAWRVVGVCGDVVGHGKREAEPRPEDMCAVQHQERCEQYNGLGFKV